MVAWLYILLTAQEPEHTEKYYLPTRVNFMNTICTRQNNMPFEKLLRLKTSQKLF